MSRRPFQTAAIAHLLDYKKKNAELSELGEGTYNYRGSLITYPHILPRDSRFLNFLPEYRSELTARVAPRVSELHRYFHHLNSSQAMCLNFFLPLEHEKKLEWISEYLGFPGESVDYQSACFEKAGVDGRAEKNWRHTSFDYYYKTTTGKKFYFEIKYTEDGFGAKSEKDRDEAAMEKFESVYLPLLRGAIRPEYHVPELFFDNYQITRNLAHLGQDSYVVFLYPQDNRKIAEDAENVKERFLVPEYHNHFFAVTWEQLYEGLREKLLMSDRLARQFEAFSEKYLPSANH